MHETINGKVYPPSENRSEEKTLPVIAPKD